MLALCICVLLISLIKSAPDDGDPPLTMYEKTWKDFLDDTSIRKEPENHKH